MIMKEYIPNPVEPSEVKRSEELLPLIEKMANNVHENTLRLVRRLGFDIINRNKD